MKKEIDEKFNDLNMLRIRIFVSTHIALNINFGCSSSGTLTSPQLGIQDFINLFF